jgi:hypothetical protein
MKIKWVNDNLYFRSYNDVNRMNIYRIKHTELQREIEEYITIKNILCFFQEKEHHRICYNK